MGDRLPTTERPLAACAVDGLVVPRDATHTWPHFSGGKQPEAMPEAKGQILFTNSFTSFARMPFAATASSIAAISEASSSGADLIWLRIVASAIWPGAGPASARSCAGLGQGHGLRRTPLACEREHRGMFNAAPPVWCGGEWSTLLSRCRSESGWSSTGRTSHASSDHRWAEFRRP